MTGYTLNSAAERQHYVEGIFQCLDRHMISEYDACRDMKTLILSLTSLTFDLAEERALIRRLAGVLRAYQSKGISQQAARTHFEDAVEAAVRNDAAYFAQPGTMTDA
jgi:hypothetical protein